MFKAIMEKQVSDKVRKVFEFISHLMYTSFCLYIIVFLIQEFEQLMLLK
jgi:hypothetical protein